MSLQIFFDNFGVLADEPNGIVKLRALVLRLAVQGRLVPQEPHDEPASRLLKRLKAEERRLFNNGEIREPKPLPPIEKEEQPFPLPNRWEWVRLGEIGLIVSGGTPSTNNPDYFASNGIPWLTPADLYGLRGKYIGRGKKDISEQGLEKSSAQLMPAGSVLFSSRAPIGYVAIASNPLTTNQGFKSCVPFLEGMNEYIYYFLKSAAEGLNEAASGTTFKEIPGKQFRLVAFPLPPLEEQKRIVAKVDELMPMCDELEARQQARRKSRSRLNSTTLWPLNNASSLEPDELAQASTRLAVNFNALYDSVETVGKLRSTILKLAVQGKLVPQDKRDDPASTLIEKIAREKASRSNGRESRNLKAIPVIEELEGPFMLPAGWVWTRFGDVTINRDGERIPVEKSVRQSRHGEYDYYGASGVIDKIDEYLFDRPLLLIGEDGANLINRSTPIAFIAQGKYWVNNHAHVLDSISVECLEYLEVFINATDVRPYITGTAQPKMNQAKMNSILVAIPPEEEQKRIVAKVNQLLTLCDELETKLRQANEDSEKLMSAAVKYVLDTISNNEEIERELTSVL